MDLFDKLALPLFDKLGLGGLYRKYPRLQKFMKYGSWIMLEYWFVKSPLTIFFTEWFGLWYIMSAFLSGLICTGIGFVLSEWWIWKKRG